MYVTFGLWHEPFICPSVRPSVCPSVRPSVRLSVGLSSVRLSSVTLLHPMHRLELFGDIFSPPQGLGQCVLKLWAEIPLGFRRSCKISTGSMKNCVFRPIYRFISETLQDTAIVTMEDE